MKYKVFSVGEFGANCYVVWDEKTLCAVIIDPGADDDRIKNFIFENDLQPMYIVLTHSHFDHTNGINGLLTVFDVKIAVHKLDADGLTNMNLSLTNYFGIGKPQKPADILLNDGDKIDFGSVSLKVIHTPGHSVGGICLYAENTLFSGDTLFCESVGRCDFPVSSEPELKRSIKNRLFLLPDSTVVLPGHGRSTTILHEKQFNPYVNTVGE